MLASVAMVGAVLTASSVETPIQPSGDVSSRENRWREDLEYFARELPARHVQFAQIVSPKEFQHDVDRLSAAVPRLSDSGIVLDARSNPPLRAWKDCAQPRPLEILLQDSCALLQDLITPNPLMLGLISHVFGCVLHDHFVDVISLLLKKSAIARRQLRSLDVGPGMHRT
ncbi:MAG: hypothetical protein KJ072_28335 [Verrucomicrobia bacterium]|nr:hypothetical protein [Verrucomicrobiota bacterium]